MERPNVANDPERTSRRLLSRIADGGGDGPARETLRRFDPDRLEAALDGPDVRTAFWLNVYNAFSQLLLSEYDGQSVDEGLFDVPFAFARTELSLNDVEHAILRNGDPSGLAYEPTAPAAFTARFRVGRTDPRIHFALNCGARSCPPVRWYTSESLERELECASEQYLSSAVEYDATTGTVSVPELFEWFAPDFGGESGVVSFLRSYGAVPDAADPRLEYREWDWTVVAGNVACGDA